jgi:hypothetical protein
MAQGGRGPMGKMDVFEPNEASEINVRDRILAPET